MASSVGCPRPFAHQDTALDDVRLVDDVAVFHMIGTGHVAKPDHRSLLNLGNILNPERCAALRRQHSIFDILNILVQT